MPIPLSTSAVHALCRSWFICSKWVEDTQMTRLEELKEQLRLKQSDPATTDSQLAYGFLTAHAMTLIGYDGTPLNGLPMWTRDQLAATLILGAACNHLVKGRRHEVQESLLAVALILAIEHDEIPHPLESGGRLSSTSLAYTWKKPN